MDKQILTNTKVYLVEMYQRGILLIQTGGKGLVCESLPNSLPLSLLSSLQLSLTISHPLSLTIVPPLFLS